MRKKKADDSALLDSVVNLTGDVLDVPEGADIVRLRKLVATAQESKELVAPAFPKRARSISDLIRFVHNEETRGETRNYLREAESAYGDIGEVLEVHRRDSRELFLEGCVMDKLSGISPRERLGPFIAIGGAELWFDIFFFARHYVVIESGGTAPGFVLTKARPPQSHGSSSTMDIEAGTVWVRGDLISNDLPGGAYVGVKVSGGTLRLEEAVTAHDDTVEVEGSLKGELTFTPVLDKVTPVEGGCTLSDAKIVLPDSIILKFGSGAAIITGSTGKAKAWGQEFQFTAPTGSVTFINSLWKLLIEYDVKPKNLDTDPIKNDLVTFKGKAKIKTAGLALPVIVPPSTSILGAGTNSPGWILDVKDFLARWYYPDERFHHIAKAWVGIFARGALLSTSKVNPLDRPVTHNYRLWVINDSDKQRLPWKQTYKKPFKLFYRCDVIDGEQFIATGQCDLSFDRPVTTDGTPVAISATTGVLHLHRFGSRIKATLGTISSIDDTVEQFALRNALVWTTLPVVIVVEGRLQKPDNINVGKAHLLFGVYGWVPTLPDPYVANVSVRGPDKVGRGLVQALLAGGIKWTTPENVKLSFEGLLGSPAAFNKKDSSPGEPRPAGYKDSGPNIGLTQVDQGQMHLDKEALVYWHESIRSEYGSRKKRLKSAEKANSNLMQRIDAYMAKMLGPTPPILLLDVSTNQDLFGVALSSGSTRTVTARSGTSGSYWRAYSVAQLDVHSQMAGIRVVTLPQIQWEPVRTLDEDQDIMTLGWFPTPLASATDGGATVIGVRSQHLVPVIPEYAISGSCEAFSDGEPVVFRTTLPFGLLSLVQVHPKEVAGRSPDSYDLTRPRFPDKNSVGGIQITAKAEISRDDPEGISPFFLGYTGQLINGVDLASGAPLGLSVLGSAGDPNSNVEFIFNADMASNPKVPVTRFDLSGYGGSNFSDWNNPFSAFAEAAKVQFQVMIGRTVLEVIKVNSVLHPWGIRVTRSITIERRPGGGVIRRDSGWQAFTPGMFDYRYIDADTKNLVVADYKFDAGVFEGLFNVRSIRPAPGTEFSHGSATLVPYYFDAEVAIEGLSDRVMSVGMLGYLQTTPNGEPASASALKSLIETQGPIGGPIDAWLDFGFSGLPYRATRVEVGLSMDGTDPIFVATLRGVPKLPTTGSWTVATRQVAGVPPGGGEAVNVSESRGVPLIRRYPVAFSTTPPGSPPTYSKPPHDSTTAPIGAYRFADANDLLTPSSPANEYVLLQTTPTHAFIFPRPYVESSDSSRIKSDTSAALADIIARSTSKGAFPPPENSIELPAGSKHLNVGSGGTLTLSSPISIVNHPTPLQIAGSEGHGTTLYYDDATLSLKLEADNWQAEFTGMRVLSDIAGLKKITGSEMRVVGSTNQRSQIAEIRSLILPEIEEILQYIPIFGSRGIQGPVDLGVSNAKHEFKVNVMVKYEYPPPFSVEVTAGSGVTFKFYVKQSTGFDPKTGGQQVSATFGAAIDGRFPVLSIGVAAVFIIVGGKIEFSLASVSGELKSEKLDLYAFVGVGVEGRIGPFFARSYLSVGFVLSYNILEDKTKYGGLVALEARVDVAIVRVTVRAELQGLVYDDGGTTKCDYSGKVKVQVDIFLIISISASYQITETATF